MKKFLAVLCALCLMVMPALAENAEFSLASLQNVMFEFSSGAGGWFTSLQIAEDGTFTGSFHDSEMGDIGENYPNGSVYVCDFTGKLSLSSGEIAPGVWEITIDELSYAAADTETIAEGIRYITADPYGLTLGHKMKLYLPGYAVSSLNESEIYWFHLNDISASYENLPYYGLYDAESDCGFVGWEMTEDN